MKQKFWDKTKPKPKIKTPFCAAFQSALSGFLQAESFPFFALGLAAPPRPGPPRPRFPRGFQRRAAGGHRPLLPPRSRRGSAAGPGPVSGAGPRTEPWTESSRAENRAGNRPGPGRAAGPAATSSHRVPQPGRWVQASGQWYGAEGPAVAGGAFPCPFGNHRSLFLICYCLSWRK